MLQGQHCLDEPGHTRGRLHVPDIGLDRPHETGIVHGPIRQRPGQSLHFDGIAQTGAGAVGLDIVQCVRRYASPGQSGADSRGLGRGVGR